MSGQGLVCPVLGPSNSCGYRFPSCILDSHRPPSLPLCTPPAGLFARADAQNTNGRVYPKAILQREVARFKEQHVRKGTALGELNHPSYFSSYFRHLNLPNVSHQVLDLRWRGPELWGTLEVLPTPAGLLLSELYSKVSCVVVCWLTAGEQLLTTSQLACSHTAHAMSSSCCVPALTPLLCSAADQQFELQASHVLARK